MFYITKGKPAEFCILGYLTQASAERYQPECVIHEDSILASDFGFEGSDKDIIRGYKYNKSGRVPSCMDGVPRKAGSIISIYVRASDGSWILHANLDKFSASAIESNPYQEVLMVQNCNSLNENPRDLLPDLKGFIMEVTEQPSQKRGNPVPDYIYKDIYD